MIPLLLLSLVAPVVVGWWVTGFGWTTAQAGRPSLVLRLCLSAGLGFGLCSLGFFLWTLISGRPRFYFVTAELAVVLGLTALLVRRVRRQKPVLFAGTPSSPLTRRKSSLVLMAAFSLASLASIATFILTTRDTPEGGWDAWTQWNLHARILFRAGARWIEVYGPVLNARHLDFYHSDYPLLLAASIARCWTYVGRETTIIPALLAMSFTFGTVALVASSLSVLRGLNQGLLGGIVLVGTPFFIGHGASQYADVPLGFFLLATLVLFSLHGRSSKNSRLLVLGGLSAGLAAWTKNEGLLFVPVVLTSRLMAVAPRQGLKRYIIEMFAFAQGLLPVLLVIALFKSQTTSSDLMAAEGLLTKLHHLVEPSRYTLTARWFQNEILDPGFGGWIVNLLPILPFYLLLQGENLLEDDRPALVTAVFALCSMLCGYFLVYILSPDAYEALQDRLRVSADRLFLQLWPSAVFALLLLANPPGPIELRGRVAELDGAANLENARGAASDPCLRL